MDWSIVVIQPMIVTIRESLRAQRLQSHGIEMMKIADEGLRGSWGKIRSTLEANPRRSPRKLPKTNEVLAKYVATVQTVTEWQDCLGGSNDN
jgi:hypothetical protein